ncbi:hypothetical protein H1P_30017 [Hyella patelloides LEGE 07179]|uniref:Uncharacterized protein n=1 Tax=Hyella patelloides LEGE 07179 TaxID=945734 RepID=A0A563VUJ1_9CYAN|nr:hypothetical protein [Hyella patelloides]VEP14941.1 hypothetical protein H1P_30017 [Hyella patelloides LEGE 07179]
MTYSSLKSTATTNKKLSSMGYRTRSTKTKIANGRHIAAGAIITNQITANSLPSVNSVIHRRQAQANRKTLFNGKHLYVVGKKREITGQSAFRGNIEQRDSSKRGNLAESRAQTTPNQNNIVVKNYTAA